MRYKIGDVVRVRDDLVEGESYEMDGGIDYDTFVYGMDRFMGQDVKIDHIEYGKYHLVTMNNEMIPCHWTDGMLEDVNSIDASDLDFEEVFG